jgi:tetratricopeptide (TPR) repeat protein
MDVLDQALTTLDAGGLIIVADDEERENEGDFIGLADRVTPEMINFMITYGRGLVCFPIASPLADRLKLSRMVPDTEDPLRTAFTQSIDAHRHYALGLWYQTVPRALGGSVSRALSYFHAATRLAPDQIGFWMGLGRCAMAARQWHLAERAFQQAVQLPAQTLADQRRHFEAYAWLLRWHPERETGEVRYHA